MGVLVSSGTGPSKAYRRQGNSLAGAGQLPGVDSIGQSLALGLARPFTALEHGPQTQTLYGNQVNSTNG